MAASALGDGFVPGSVDQPAIPHMLGLVFRPRNAGKHASMIANNATG
jgi:hypothetical protein